jgi:6-phosphogluconolactonase
LNRETQILADASGGWYRGPNGLAADLVYVGTYTNWEALEPPHRTPPGARSEGIYVFRFDSASGQLEPLALAAAAENPTFLNFSPDGRFLYAANELYRFHDQASGAVSAFSLDRASGKLIFLNQVAARGTGTCYVRTDRTGKFLLLANYGSGSVAVAPVMRDGTLGSLVSFVQQSGSGPSPRQAGPHAHSLSRRTTATQWRQTWAPTSCLSTGSMPLRAR